MGISVVHACLCHSSLSILFWANLPPARTFGILTRLDDSKVDNLNIGHQASFGCLSPISLAIPLRNSVPGNVVQHAALQRNDTLGILVTYRLFWLGAPGTSKVAERLALGLGEVSSSPRKRQTGVTIMEGGGLRTTSAGASGVLLDPEIDPSLEGMFQLVDYFG
ncbi:hypothetical protein EDB83DRAFT_2332956 [Lactarius deliciosus]|nr:hypothetical protein EDB83DRAFT_2332956 [Lactarius deliciosus]